jgi:hypothetical protein
MKFWAVVKRNDQFSFSVPLAGFTLTMESEAKAHDYMESYIEKLKEEGLFTGIKYTLENIDLKESK